MKVLATADVHVESWSLYEVYPGFRLRQYERLAEWLVHLIDHHKVEAVLIAGDLFHKPVNPPKVLLTGVRLVKSLSERAPVVLIHGQHDLDTRDRVSEGRSNSLVSLLEEVKRDNVYYLHNSSIHINGSKIFGYGWEPVFAPDLSEARGAHIVLLHGQVKGSRTRNREFDEGIRPLEYFPNSFIIVGDIHQHQVLGEGRIVIPGPPIYHTFSDGSAGVVILDTDAGEVEFVESGRVGTERVYYFLNFVQVQSSDPEQKGNKDIVDPQNLTVTRIKGNTVTREVALSPTRNPLEIIRSVMETEGLAGPFDYLVKKLPQSSETPYESPHYWIPKEMEVEGFRSIGQLKINFEELGKLVFVSGPNGSGKSSLLMALRFVLTGEGDRSLIMSGKDYLRVSLRFEYMGRDFFVERALTPTQTLGVWVDGEPVEASSLREKQERFESLFPPARTFSEISFFDQFRPGLVSSMPPKQRVELVSQVFGLLHISELEEVAKEELEGAKNEVRALESRRDTITSTLQSFEAISKELASMQVSESEKEEYEFLHSLVNDLQADISGYRERLASLQKSKAEVEARLAKVSENLKKTQITGRCYVCGSVLGGEKLSSLVENLQEEGSRLQSEMEKLEDEISKIRRKEVEASKSLTKILERYHELAGKVAQYSRLAHKYQQVLSILSQTKDELSQVSSHLDREASWADALNRLIKVLTSKAYATVLEKISDVLSSEKVRVSLAQVFKTGSVKPTVDLYLKVSEDLELPFESLSGGQRTLADLHFLFHLISTLDGLGILVFDETFRFLDPNAYEQVFEMLKECNARHVIYVSHDVSPAMRFDTQITVMREDNGTSRYVFD